MGCRTARGSSSEPGGREEGTGRPVALRSMARPHQRGVRLSGNVGCGFGMRAGASAARTVDQVNRWRYHTSVSAPPVSTPSHVGFLLGKLGYHATRTFAAALEHLGLRPKHYGVLLSIAREGGISQQELGERLRIDPSSIVAIIDDFERAGVAERRRDPADRRRYAIFLTPGGEALLGRAREAAAAAEQTMLAPLDPQERDALLILLGKLAAGVAPPAA